MFSCVTFCASEIMGDHCPIRQSRSPKGTPPRPGSSSSTPAPPIFILILSLSPHPVRPPRPLTVRSAPFPAAPLHILVPQLGTSHPCVRLSPSLPSLIAPASRRWSSVPRSSPSSASTSPLLAHNHWTLPPAAHIPFRRPCRRPLPVPAPHCSHHHGCHTRSFTPENREKRISLKKYFCVNR